MSDRARGLLRWEEWLEGRLSPHGVIREKPGDPESGEVVWRVSFRDETRAWVHVTERAVRLDQDVFEDLTDGLERIGWIHLIERARPGGLRIHQNGAIKAVPPEERRKESA